VQAQTDALTESKTQVETLQGEIEAKEAKSRNREVVRESQFAEELDRWAKILKGMEERAKFFFEHGFKFEEQLKVCTEKYREQQVNIARLEADVKNWTGAFNEQKVKLEEALSRQHDQQTENQHQKTEIEGLHDENQKQLAYIQKLVSNVEGFQKEQIKELLGKSGSEEEEVSGSEMSQEEEEEGEGSSAAPSKYASPYATGPSSEKASGAGASGKVGSQRKQIGAGFP
jgi:hypothetical protein